MIITDIAIWVYGAGHISRLQKLIQFLTKYSFVTVVYLGREPLRSIERFLPPRVNIVFLENSSREDKKRNIDFIGRLFSFEQYKVCFFEYIHHARYLASVPDEVITILDTHDIISERNRSFNSLQYANWDYNLSREREFKIYRLFDYVILISKKDYDTVTEAIGAERLILAPHPATPRYQSLRSRPSAIGFIASDYLPNVDSISWFLRKVWPLIPPSIGVKLHIFGAVGRKIAPSLLSVFDNVILEGFKDNLTEVYKNMDVIINPVRIGSGLKIKNIEALANGLPLITTTHGASGLEKGINNSFLIADDPDTFAESLLMLINDNELRHRLGKNAYQWVADEFSDEVCFKKIGDLLSA
ncbi:glycosyltransferase family 4 protein [Olivibacter sp. 47]|uniref:glycosyltransferase family 4 protein n=1 Tax=Olivibacter sp. 47 TaxID=3056486 RepID=UPI0025A4B03E|nr:glycosyltransferase family 4 protein [Olivibacter sp. 47]MDM8173665.1 glycosyltransferase family 4 protein [Olivibacter sp. 47]